ncbi:hypothetical protein MKR01_19520, partial [Klebsiella sp. K4-154]|nr:hypothetical protein [Klebsiella sp. K4-154]
QRMAEYLVLYNSKRPHKSLELMTPVDYILRESKNCNMWWTHTPGLRHQDIPWTTEALLAAERVQYTSQQFYDYYIHSESVSHKPDNDDTLMRSARHYMKILEMLEAINQRYPDKVRHIAACRWQIAKEGLGIIHTFDSMKDESKKHVIINEFFDRGIWRLIWKNACTFRLRWRLGRRYLRIKRYRHAG